MLLPLPQGCGAFATNPISSYQVLHQVNAMYGSTCCLQSLATCGCCWASISRWAGALLAQGQSLYQWLLASVYCLFFHCTTVQVLFVTPGCWPSESPTESPPATAPKIRGRSPEKFSEIIPQWSNYACKIDGGVNEQTAHLR